MEKKKSNKITIKFFITLAIAMIIGAIGGYVVASQVKNVLDIFLIITGFLQNNAYIFLAANLLFAVASFCYYIKGNRMALAVDPEDDESFAKADCAYGTALNLSGICITLAFIFFGFATSGMSTIERISFFVPVLVSVGLLFVTLGVVITLQHFIVKATKALYPEKRGNVLDSKFQKDWLASCDEAEQKMIGECAYKSYTALSQIMPFLFVVCIFLGIAMDIGVAPYIVLGIVWLVMSQSYYFAGVKLQKKK